MSLAHAKAHLSEILNIVESGQEVLITRHGRPVARVLPPNAVEQALPLAHLAKLRQQLPAHKGSSAVALRDAE